MTLPSLVSGSWGSKVRQAPELLVKGATKEVVACSRYPCEGGCREGGVTLRISEWKDLKLCP